MSFRNKRKCRNPSLKCKNPSLKCKNEQIKGKNGGYISGTFRDISGIFRGHFGKTTEIQGNPARSTPLHPYCLQNPTLRTSVVWEKMPEATHRFNTQGDCILPFPVPDSSISFVSPISLHFKVLPASRLERRDMTQTLRLSLLVTEGWIIEPPQHTDICWISLDKNYVLESRARASTQGTHPSGHVTHRS